MSIDPAKLEAQRRVIASPAAPALHLVTFASRVCACGEALPEKGTSDKCRRCRNREGMRRARASSVISLGRRGPRMDPDRACEKCGGMISLVNRSGVCTRCSHEVFYARKRFDRWFTDGGGI